MSSSSWLHVKWDHRMSSLVRWAADCGLQSGGVASWALHCSLPSLPAIHIHTVLKRVAHIPRQELQSLLIWAVFLTKCSSDWSLDQVMQLARTSGYALQAG